MVEVLSVIAIIAVLAAVLLPCLSSAFRRSKVVSCTQKLAQLGAATNLYEQDYDNCVPASNPRQYLIYGAGGSNPHGSADALEPYGATAALYKCPLRPIRPAKWDTVSDYFFRFTIDFSSLNNGTEKDLRITPEPSTVIAWDPNHGMTPVDQDPKVVWLALREDQSVQRIPRTALKESYFVDGAWTFKKPNGYGQSIYVPVAWVFPNEPWPIQLSPTN